MLKHVCKSGSAGFLPSRPDMGSQRHSNDRIRTIHMENNLETVRKGEFFVVDLEDRAFLGGVRNGYGQ